MTAPIDPKADHVSVYAAANEFGWSSKSLYRAIADGRVPPGVYWRIGRNIRVSRSRLAQWLANGGTAGSQ